MVEERQQHTEATAAASIALTMTTERRGGGRGLVEGGVGVDYHTTSK